MDEENTEQSVEEEKVEESETIVESTGSRNNIRVQGNNPLAR